MAVAWRWRIAAAIVAGWAGAAQAGDPLKTLSIDFALYNPLSYVVRDQHLLEDALGSDVKVQWVPSLNAGRALENLATHTLDVASGAGSSALLARASGNPVKVVYVFSQPDWTALVARPDSPIHAIDDLRGKRVAASGRSDAELFLLRALATTELGPHDITILPLKDADGRMALDRSEVDAWAGFDPFMAEAELETHDRIFYRNRAFVTPGVLAVRDKFVAAYPDAIRKVAASYERGRRWALAHKDEFAKLLVADAKLSPTVAARQLERTDLSDPAVGDALKRSVAAAGEALKAAGMVAPDADLEKIEGNLLDADFTQAPAPPG